eukprot:TRINITY_DN8612_c0_g1_i1.p1 TRINITY_DN8612_c0_g1~~TRINITY_DN8612_c0_g1_i1.p1  ORF type:complete len:456 (+),score=116.88 TRINITY_DN8612_c0_g1_i1:56-1423(+)
MERLSVLERIRVLHEENERRERAICQDWERTPKTHKQQLTVDHAVNSHIEKISENSQKLVQLYADDTKEKEKEIGQLGSQRTNVFALFYSRLKEIREHHYIASEDPLNYENPQDFSQVYDGLEQLDFFTGEEMQGKLVDLHALHQRYINMKQFSRIDYLAFLRKAFKFEDVPRDQKNEQYKQYIEDLLAYLKSFQKRSSPLMQYSMNDKEFKDSFEAQWAEGKVPGWETVSDNPLFCLACNKLFAKQTVFDSHVIGKKHIKAAADLQLKGIQPTGKPSEKQKAIAWIEAQISKFADLLQDKIDATITNVEKKQSQTPEELEKEKEAEEEIEEEEEDDDDEKPLYNPLNLPLGWDGKPIPYWLYKLHGLSIEFKCQICGGESYFGPRNFERHFQEFTHINGLKALGIPNLPHFRMITEREDAKECKTKEPIMPGWLLCMTSSFEYQTSFLITTCVI